MKRKVNFQKYLIWLFDNPLGKWYLDCPTDKKIYKITQSSVHYFTGELSKKNGQPVICTGNCSPNGKFVFNRIMKLAKVVSVFAFLPFFPESLMPLIALTDTGWHSPQSCGGEVNMQDFTNPTNAYTSNNEYATCTVVDGVSKYEEYHNFGFGIPAGATINGIEMNVEHYESVACYVYIYIYDGDGSYKKATNIWRTSEGTDTLGGSNDLWGGNWTPEYLNSTTNTIMWVQFYRYDTNVTMYLDHLQIKVYYTETVDYTLTAAVGTFTLTGIATLFTKALSMIASVGTFTLTGINNILSRGYTLIANAGSFILTGIAALLKRGYTLVASVGSFTLTGITTTFTKALNLIASVGSFTLTGIDVILKKGYTLAVSVGTFTLTGINALFTKVLTMIASVGSFILTGIANTLTRAKLAEKGLTRGKQVAYPSGKDVPYQKGKSQSISSGNVKY